MGQATSIEWTDATWNPVRGCSRVSEGCRNCYAERQAARFSGPGRPFDGYVRIQTGVGPQWTGKVELLEKHLDDPRHMKARRIFVNSMSDLFHEALSAPDIARVYARMYRIQWHEYQVLTKRDWRRKDLFSRSDFWDLVSQLAGFRCEPAAKHIWEGVSVEDTESADERIPLLRQTPAAVRFLSIEPLIEDIGELDLHKIDWVIVGGESGPQARPMRPEWVRGIRDQCVARGVRFFFKQWGGLIQTAGGRLLDGREWSEFPAVVA